MGLSHALPGHAPRQRAAAPRKRTWFGCFSGCSAKLANVENVACRPLSGTVRAPSFPGTVFTIVMENRNAAEIIRPGGPPFLNELARTYAYAANYWTPPLHPSEPNYIWMTSGQNFGILDNDAPALNHIAATSHLANQIEAAGHRLSFVFQEATLMPWARVQANVRLPLDLAGVPRARADARVHDALKLVGLEAFAGHLPREAIVSLTPILLAFDVEHVYRQRACQAPQQFVSAFNFSQRLSHNGVSQRRQEEDPVRQVCRVLRWSGLASSQ